MNHYSTLKAAWHLDRMQALREGKRIAPVELQLILSDLCNHDCHFCAYRASNGLSTERFAEGETKNPNRMIPADKAQEIIIDAAAAGIKSVIFTGGGEPTVHPQHIDLFRLALELRLECSLNTNGVTFREGWREVYPKFTYVRFSVDASCPTEYSVIRRCPSTHYMRIIKNLNDLREEIELADSPCVVGTGYVVTPGNYKNLRMGVKRLRDAGAHYVRLAAMQSTEGTDAYEGKWQDALDAAAECAVLETDDFKVYNLMEGVVGDRPDYGFCGFQHMVLYVGGNLECYRCCYTAYTAHGLVGDLKDQSLADYLGSREIEPFDARSCEVCPLNDKNRVIDYLTQKEPTHVNFV